jgi:UDP-sulfoquinovose synthase
VNELAAKVRRVGNERGLGVELVSIMKPCKAAKEHYYNSRQSGLLELRLKPHYMTDEGVAEMFRDAFRHKVLPRVWRS